MIDPLALERLAVRVSRKVSDSGATFATAESGTGGLLCELLSRMPGGAYRGGAIVDSDAEKIRLGVRPETLDQNTAVSKFTVAEMTKAARARFGVDIAVAISGFAGPDGGTPDNPIGTVFIEAYGPARPGNKAAGQTPATHVAMKKLSSPGAPDEIRRLAAWWALELVDKVLDAAAQAKKGD